MSDSSDPKAIRQALDSATDAFEEAGGGLPAYERDIDTDTDWKTQLTKGCKLLRAVDTLDGRGQHTATIKLCFGVIERSLEAFALAEGGDDLADFQDHTMSYDRAADLGLLSRAMTGKLSDLYADNRTDSYYGGKRPTQEQAQAMHVLARTIHEYAADRIREGGVCRCE